MSIRVIHWRSCLALILALVALGARAEAPAPDHSAATFEVRFLERMIDHHAMAVHMASLCEGRTAHEELQSMCTAIATTQQQQEIATMRSWLEDWYGISYEPMMHNMQHMERLSSMAGAGFETLFMEMMIRHHKGAVREGSRCLDQAYHEDLLSLCEDIIVAQTLELGQMREWLCDWYAICRRA